MGNQEGQAVICGVPDRIYQICQDSRPDPIELERSLLLPVTCYLLLVTGYHPDPTVCPTFQSVPLSIPIMLESAHDTF